VVFAVLAALMPKCPLCIAAMLGVLGVTGLTGLAAHVDLRLVWLGAALALGACSAFVVHHALDRLDRKETSS
jgi:NhaP-type Na+/H+ and K+/H+ antiporter